MSRKWITLLMLLCLSCFSLTPIFARHETAGTAPNAAVQPGRKLIVGVMDAPPYSMQEEDGTWTGITVDLWKNIARTLGVDYEFKKVQLSELLSGLSNGSIDVGATGVSITEAREEKIDFSDPYLAASEAVAINAADKPSLMQMLRSAFTTGPLLVFSLTIIGLAALGAIMLWLLEHRGDSEHYSGKTGKALGKSLFWSTVVLTGREFPKAIGWSTVSPSTFAGRLFGTIWMMVGVLSVSLFTATAASIFTSKELEGIVHDPNDLYHIKVGSVARSVGHEYLKNRNIKCSHLYANPREMMQALADHKVDAVVFNRHIMVYYAKTMYLNKITVLRIPLKLDFLALPLRPKMGITEQINIAMLHIVESKDWPAIVSTYLGNDWFNPNPTQSN